MSGSANVFLAACLCLGLMAGCQANPQGYESGANIHKSPQSYVRPYEQPTHGSCPSAYDLMVSDARLSVLKAAIDAAGLAGTLMDTNFMGTVFAPSNDAVATCYSIGCLTRNTILYHIIKDSSYNSLGLLATGNPSSYAMANGGVATVNLNGPNVYITSAYNFAKVIDANKAFCKGYVHIIDAVLNPTPAPAAKPPTSSQPPACAPSAYDLISSMPVLAGFKSLIDRSGRADFFKNPHLHATIFAPADCRVGPLGVNEGFVVDLHVVEGKVLSAPLPLAGMTLVSRSRVSYKMDFDSPPNRFAEGLRLNANGYSNLLDPSQMNIAACSFTMHVVGTTFWNLAPIAITGSTSE